MTSNKTNRVGIISFDAFSIPSRIPWMITKCVTPMMMTSQKMGRMPLVEKSAKYCFTKLASPWSCPMMEA